MKGNNGYSLAGYYYLNQESWIESYSKPLEARSDSFLERNNSSEPAKKIVAEDYKAEIVLYKKFKDYYSYGFYIARKKQDKKWEPATRDIKHWDLSVCSTCISHIKVRFILIVKWLRNANPFAHVAIVCNFERPKPTDNLKPEMMNTVLHIATSLDGFIAKPNGNLDWLTSIPDPHKGDYGYAELLNSIGTIIMGRKTYEEIIGFGVE